MNDNKIRWNCLRCGRYNEADFDEVPKRCKYCGTSRGSR